MLTAPAVLQSTQRLWKKKNTKLSFGSRNDMNFVRFTRGGKKVCSYYYRVCVAVWKMNDNKIQAAIAMQSPTVCTLCCVLHIHERQNKGKRSEVSKAWREAKQRGIRIYSTIERRHVRELMANVPDARSSSWEILFGRRIFSIPRLYIRFCHQSRILKWSVNTYLSLIGLKRASTTRTFCDKKGKNNFRRKFQI